MSIFQALNATTEPLSSRCNEVLGISSRRRLKEGLQLFQLEPKWLPDSLVARENEIQVTQHHIMAVCEELDRAVC